MKVSEEGNICHLHVLWSRSVSRSTIESGCLAHALVRLGGKGLCTYKAMCAYVIGIFYKTRGIEPSINDIIIVLNAGPASSENGEQRRTFSAMVTWRALFMAITFAKRCGLYGGPGGRVL